MVAWRMRTENDTWEDVVERAYAGEPQYLTRDGVEYRIRFSFVRVGGADAERLEQERRDAGLAFFNKYYGAAKDMTLDDKVERIAWRDEKYAVAD